MVAPPDFSRTFTHWADLARRLFGGDASVTLEELLTSGDPTPLYLLEDAERRNSVACLWEEELAPTRAWLGKPYRLQGQHEIQYHGPFTIRAMTLGELHASPDEVASSALWHRLRTFCSTVAFYEKASLPEHPEWVWAFDGDQPLPLLLRDGRVVWPEHWPWRSNIDSDELSEIFFLNHARVVDGAGRFHLVDAEGRLRFPQGYAYLSAEDGDPPAVEVSDDPAAPACDLITLEGARLNPPGIAVLTNTLQAGHALVQADDAGEVAPFGFINTRGVLVGPQRWFVVHPFADGMAAVQCPENGLWGFLNEQGDEAVPCRFARVENFCVGYAEVWPEENGLHGLIDHQGRYAVEPVANDITCIMPGLYLVTTPDGERHLADMKAGGGLTRLPVDKSLTQREIMGQFWGMPFEGTPRPASAPDDWARDNDIDVLLPPLDSLAHFAGRFNRETTRLDLVAQGLWGMEVRVVRDGQWNNCKLHASDTGVIAWPTYVSQSTFNLAEEAPVMGLEPYPQAAIGIPWSMLEKLEDDTAPAMPKPKTSPWVKALAIVYALMFLWILVSTIVA